jgi:hypothetical protein
MHLFLLVLVVGSVCCLGRGLWIGYRDLYPDRPQQGAMPELPDEELLIFDRVTSGISELPRLNDPKAFQDALGGVMQEVGQQYGLTSLDVEKIYWRARRSTHDPRR